MLIASCLTTVAFYDRNPSTGALDLILSIPQESIDASALYSTAASQTTGALYVASAGTDRIVVVPEPVHAAAAALGTLGALIARRRS